MLEYKILLESIQAKISELENGKDAGFTFPNSELSAAKLDEILKDLGYEKISSEGCGLDFSFEYVYSKAGSKNLEVSGSPFELWLGIYE